MKIIDFKKYGNVVRFFLGDDNCNNYWGDDWNDVPYEHNAEQVYEEYIDKYVDYAFDVDTLVLEPQDDWHWQGNSPYSKQSMKNGDVPCIVIVPPDVKQREWDTEFGFWVGNKNAVQIYFNDDYADFEMNLVSHGVQFAKIFEPKKYMPIVYLDELPEPLGSRMGAEYRIGKQAERYIVEFKDGSYSWRKI